jgi:AcrR family transcriptional regulator
MARPAPSVKGGTLTTRDRIVEAADRVMRTLGLARATTKEIARAAGFSEATLYKHFRDKEELFLCVLRERFPPFIATLQQLPERVGRGPVRETVTEVARTAMVFYEQVIPMAASLFSEPALLARHRDGLRRGGGGPHQGNRVLAAYLRAEQGLGRVSGRVNPEAAAALLLGACFQRAFLRDFVGEESISQSDEQFAEDLAQALLEGVASG